MLIVLVGLAFALRLLVGLARGESSFLENGYGFYLGLAKGLLDGSGLCWAPGEWCAYRMPLYPILISPFLWSGWTYPGLVVLQALIGAAMVWAAWRLGLELFDARIGLLAAGMTALSPYAVVHDTALQDSVVVNAFAAVGVALLLWAAHVSSRWLPLLAGAALALAVLTSARIAFILPIALAWTVMYGGRHRRIRLRRAALVALPIVVLVGGWTARNWRVTGWPVLSTQAGADLWAANSPWTFAHFPRQSIDLSAAEAMTRLTAEQSAALDEARSNEIASSRLLATWAFQYMKAHPLETVWGGARKVWVVASAQLSPARGTLVQAGYVALYGTVHLLAIIGMWRARANWRRHALVWAILVSFLVTTAIYWAHTSHKSVVDIFLFAYAGAALRGRAITSRVFDTPRDFAIGRVPA